MFTIASCLLTIHSKIVDRNKNLANRTLGYFWGPPQKNKQVSRFKKFTLHVFGPFWWCSGFSLGKKHIFPGVSKHESQAFGEGFVDRCLGDIAMFDGLNLWGFLHPRKLTWQWNIPMFNRNYIFKWLIFHCHVSFRRGTHPKWWILPLSWQFCWCLFCCHGENVTLSEVKSPGRCG